jgi:hypothetical protein
MDLKKSESNLWDGDRATAWSPGPGEEALHLDLGGAHVLQAMYLEAGSGDASGGGLVSGIEVSLDGKKPLRYALESNDPPQPLLLQGRIASKLSLRFLTRGGAPVVREMRLLGLRYE